jgi:hypothetical protein
VATGKRKVCLLPQYQYNTTQYDTTYDFPIFVYCNDVNTLRINPVLQNSADFNENWYCGVHEFGQF